MDTQISLTSNSPDILLWIGIGLIILTVCYLRFLVVVDKTRRAYRALQPDVGIMRSATIYSNSEDILTIRLRNNGGSDASDIRVTVHGGEGFDPLPLIQEMKPRNDEHEVWIKAKSGSPLLREKRNNIRLKIRYRDQWGYPYTLAYPVVQRESTYGRVVLRLVDRGKRQVSKPAISFFTMRKHLALHSWKTRKQKGDLGETFDGKIDIGCDESLSQSLIHSYLGRVWQTQNKRGYVTDRIAYYPPESPFTSN